MEKLKDAKFESLRGPYAQAITDLAWYLAFTGSDPAQAEKLLPTLKAMLPDMAPVLVRIEGWISKEQKKLDQASIKLKAVADQDVLAQAGTLLIWCRTRRKRKRRSRPPRSYFWNTIRVCWGDSDGYAVGL